MIMKNYLCKTFTLFALMGLMMIAQAIAPHNMINSIHAQDSEETDEAQEENQEEAALDYNTTLPIKTLNFSIIKKGRVRGTVSIVPILLVTHPTDDEIHELTSLIPLIRSDLMSVANLLAKRRFRINRPIDPNLVASHFQNRVNKRIGKDRLKIYIQDAIIRPVR